MTYFDNLRYRFENNITGDYIKLNFITGNKIDNTKTLDYKIRPIGLCLYTTKKYHVLCCAMTWSLSFVTTDLEYFEEETKDNWSGEKGKLRNQSCWNVLERIQEDVGYQSWTSLLPEIMNNFDKENDFSNEKLRG